MSTRVWIWLLSLSVLWGGSFFFAKVALAELQPLTVVFCRVALAALALNIVLAVAGRPLFRAGTRWRSFATMTKRPASGCWIGWAVGFCRYQCAGERSVPSFTVSETSSSPSWQRRCQTLQMFDYGPSGSQS